ncbi:hypothetical protein LNI90_05385 [Tenacibaculum dicentrarchi]|nr:hypothetical protein [Tenacibaculum dicentrarchi]MCD8437528.1 hypothetical protein [Tenacibaculum dicentrarchi]MCD8449593.1 hypothetical protein [Tenacibaculum dicentrarchi]MCD8451514.1 hypothetical protein [Tenacibaculum dicentrarchi]MCG8838129.1 hypothetical protein [Tenacibaculum dicentrarchi]
MKKKFTFDTVLNNRTNIISLPIVAPTINSVGLIISTIIISIIIITL